MAVTDSQPSKFMTTLLNIHSTYISYKSFNDTHYKVLYGINKNNSRVKLLYWWVGSS